jgi:hypothetical protein
MKMVWKEAEEGSEPVILACQKVAASKVIFLRNNPLRK